jgi:repressor LexA
VPGRAASGVPLIWAAFSDEVSAMSETLTERQAAVLSFIQSFVRLHGYPPTFREIARHFGYASTNAVTGHLQALERKGLLSREARRSRTLSVTGRRRRTAVAQMSGG